MYSPTLLLSFVGRSLGEVIQFRQAPQVYVQRNPIIAPPPIHPFLHVVVMMSCQSASAIATQRRRPRSQYITERPYDFQFRRYFHL